MIRRPPTSPLFPYTTLFRSDDFGARGLKERMRTTTLWSDGARRAGRRRLQRAAPRQRGDVCAVGRAGPVRGGARDRKSTRLNSSHMSISYAVFCLKKKTHTTTGITNVAVALWISRKGWLEPDPFLNPRDSVALLPFPLSLHESAGLHRVARRSLRH